MVFVILSFIIAVIPRKDKIFLKLNPETSKYPKLLVVGKPDIAGQNMPDEINPQKTEDIIYTCADFHIGFSIEGFE